MNSKINHSDNYPIYCLLIYFLIWSLLAIKTRDRFIWFLENLLVIALIFLLILTFKRFRLSNLSYSLITILLILHTIGAHHTYSEVPFIKSLFNITFDRNNYDRLAHLAFGLLMFYPVLETIRRIASIKTMHLLFSLYLPFSIVISFSALYELVEWITALIVSPLDAASFLGMQDDIFDAQKDMLMAAIGALIASIIFLLANNGSYKKYKKDRRNEN